MLTPYVASCCKIRVCCYGSLLAVADSAMQARFPPTVDSSLSTGDGWASGIHGELRPLVVLL